LGTRYMCAIPKTLMTPYHKKFGFVIGVTKLLDAANVTFHDLPYIQRHTCYPPANGAAHRDMCWLTGAP